MATRSPSDLLLLAVLKKLSLIFFSYGHSFFFIKLKYLIFWKYQQVRFGSQFDYFQVLFHSEIR